jgi:bifunctional DNA-binding transcriptional regulator/antitoxin component of YhaV-PrlF toxin-antitoxin module
MTDIAITPMEPGTFGVEVTEGTVTTGHRVTVPADLLDDLVLTDEDPVLVVRASVEFLLEREPAAAMLDEFSIADIPGYFPEYYDELKARLGR